MRISRRMELKMRKARCWSLASCPDSGTAFCSCLHGSRKSICFFVPFVLLPLKGCSFPRGHWVTSSHCWHFRIGESNVCNLSRLCPCPIKECRCGIFGDSRPRKSRWAQSSLWARAVRAASPPWVPEIRKVCCNKPVPARYLSSCRIRGDTLQHWRTGLSMWPYDKN